MKILNNLTIKHLKSNKKRTVVTIIGIVLSTALMVGIGLLFSTVRDNSLKMVIEDNGDHHVVIDVPEEKLDFIVKNDSILKYKYKSSLGYALYEGITNEYKPYIQVFSASDNYLSDLKLIEGNLPTNSSEIVISDHLRTNGEVEINVGDKITLDIGDRISGDGILLGDTPYVYEYWCDENDVCTESSTSIEEHLINTKKNTYTVVGIVERDILEDYSNPGYSAFTVGSNTDNLQVYVTFKDVTKTYKNTEILASNLGYTKLYEDSNYYQEVQYNDCLLAFSGVTNYGNLVNSMTTIIIIILTLVSLACIIVIYNSFAISVMERKKQFGLFSSVGATRKQLKYTVFFEAFIVGIIGIPLGVLSAYLGIGIVLKIINYLLPDIFGFPLALTTYPLFVIIPIIFMIITIIISAYLPAKRASRVSPIEAIRLNDDIKIKSKKLKTPWIIRKLFGVEGEIAYKNTKRNKKKYRITIISLFISIVLFISFSSLLKYGIEGAYDYTELPEYEYIIYGNTSEENKQTLDNIINQVLSIDGIKRYAIVDIVGLNAYGNDDLYSDELFEILNIDRNSLALNDYEHVNLIKLNKEAYDTYKKEIGLNSDRPILLNTYSTIIYTNTSRKEVKVKPYNNIQELEIFFYDYENDQPSSNKYLLENIYMTDVLPFGVDVNYPDVLNFVVSEELFNTIKDDVNNELRNSISTSIYLTANKYDEIDKLLDRDSSTNILDETVSISTVNIKEELKLMTNAVLVIKILLYGFISLVTLIGVTSVINTINTSIALRKKEFAVLRSIGLTPRGFNKMLLFECVLFGVKSLLYGIPVAILITILLHTSMNNIVSFDNLLIPYDSILLAIIGVFIIVMISMWYATRKIKKENILDAIREENI